VFCFAKSLCLIVSEDKNSYVKECAFSLLFLIPSKFAWKYQKHISGGKRNTDVSGQHQFWDHFHMVKLCKTSTCGPNRVWKTLGIENIFKPHVSRKLAERLRCC